jgi:hypothetical protein
VIPTLPLALRNRLAETILAALHDPAARRELAELAAATEGPPRSWLAPAEDEHAPALIERARRASEVVTARPPASPVTSVDEALAAAAALFDAGLYFEVHELLEPHWMAAGGAERETLQGLIQVAVGYQHLANGNLAGARSLLADGSERLQRAAPATLDTSDFVRGARASVARLRAVTRADVPAFPRRREDR